MTSLEPPPPIEPKRNTPKPLDSRSGSSNIDERHRRKSAPARDQSRQPSPAVKLDLLIQVKRADTFSQDNLPIYSLRIVKEAKELGFEAEHLQIALSLCGDSQPVTWLRDNWYNMIDTVVTLATNYGHERPDNDIGTLTREEATRSVLKNQGNIWNSVTECVEERRRKVTI